jgi:hypothetical protein
MDKFLIIYNVESIKFPLCGFVTEGNRNILLRIFEEFSSKHKSNKTLTFYNEENIVEVGCSEIIRALKNPLAIDMTKVPEDIANYDLASYIAEREEWIETRKDGTIYELSPENC